MIFVFIFSQPCVFYKSLFYLYFLAPSYAAITFDGNNVSHLANDQKFTVIKNYLDAKVYCEQTEVGK